MGQDRGRFVAVRNPFARDQAPPARLVALAVVLALIVLVGLLQGWVPNPLWGAPPTRALTDGGGDPEFQQRWLIAFASNADSGKQGCTRNEFRGCDLYTVEYDEARGEVSQLRRLTRYGGSGEWFSSFSSNGCWVAYTRSTFLSPGVARHYVHVMHLATGKDQQFLVDARHPDWSPDGSRFAYADAGGHTPLHIFTALVNPNCADGQISLDHVEELTNDDQVPSVATAPAFLPDGIHVAFQMFSGPETQIGLVHIDGTGFDPLTPADGSLHAFAAGTGLDVAFQNAHSPGFSHIQFNEQTLQYSAPIQLLPALPPSAYTAQDSRFGSCSRVDTSHGSFLGNTTERILFSAECVRDDTVAFSRLFLARAEPGNPVRTLIDLGTPIERLTGHAHRDTFSADARPLPSVVGP